jgi:serine/threonine-protein kinase
VPVPADPKVVATSYEEGDGAGPVLRAILQDVRSLPNDQDRQFVRYLSLAHLLTGGVTAEELDLHRAALAKAINHLSRRPGLVRPRPIDPAETVFRIDLRTLGWNEQPFERFVGEKPAGSSRVNLFDLVLLEYPYGVVFEDSETLDQLTREFLGPAGQVRPIPYVRADWFVSTATMPPLYEDFLRLPYDLKALQGRLEVDARADIDDGRAVRGGMTVSGVSRNNRVVERHPTRYGAYWLSFDFRTSKAEENLYRDPIDLRPAGGEVLFHLPNGLLGYFLADAAGNRLEAAPTEIVTDKFAQDKVVRNGLSCIRCHDAGIKGFGDDVRAAVERLPASPGFDRRKVLRLYPGQAALDPLLEEDAQRFATALGKALGKPPGREPLVAVSQRFFDAPLMLPAAAAELGTTAEKLRVLLGARPFVGMGLSPLSADGAVHRDTWEDSYARVVRELGLGIPVLPLDALTNRNLTPAGAGFDVALATNQKNNVFAPGDAMAITVANTSGRDLHIELIIAGSRGRKVILAPSSTVVKAGGSFRFPPKGTIRNKGNLGKEQITVFASDAPFPPGVLLHAEDVADRVIHPFDAADGFDPSRVLKKTIEIETR